MELYRQGETGLQVWHIMYEIFRTFAAAANLAAAAAAAVGNGVMVDKTRGYSETGYSRIRTAQRRRFFTLMYLGAVCGVTGYS